MADSTVQKDDIEEAILYAKRYLEDLLSFFGLNTEVYATTEDHEVIELNVPSTHLNGFLIGSRGDTMRSLQFLVSNALRNQDFTYARVNVDIADYKKNHARRLEDRAEEWFREVRDSGQPKELPPMGAADRRTVHKAADSWGLVTESEGEGRDRHIVLKPSSETSRLSVDTDIGEAARRSTAGKPQSEDKPKKAETKAKPKAKPKKNAGSKDKTE